MAANPASFAGLETYGIPMLPEEVAELERRLARVDDLLAFAETYATEFPDGFAGAAVDPTAGYRLVILYTQDLDLHRQRLSGIPEPLRPDVRQATWTLAELQDFESNIPVSTIVAPGIKVWRATIDTLANRVVVGFGAADPVRGDELPALFSSTGWLLPHWDGPFEPVDLPLGGLLITVVDGQGEPLIDLPCWYTSLNPAVGVDGGGDTREGGHCLFANLPMGPYRIDILEADELVDRFLKSVEVTVVGGKTIEVTIVIDGR